MYLFHRDDIWLGNTHLLYVQYDGNIYSFIEMMDLTFYDCFLWFNKNWKVCIVMFSYLTLINFIV